MTQLKQVGRQYNYSNSVNLAYPEPVWQFVIFPPYFQMLPLSTNIRDAYKNGKEDEQNFIQNLALFLCTFLKEHGILIEQKQELQNNLLEVGVLE